MRNVRLRQNVVYRTKLQLERSRKLT